MWLPEGEGEVGGVKGQIRDNGKRFDCLVNTMQHTDDEELYT